MWALGLINMVDFCTNFKDYCHAIQFRIATNKVHIVTHNVAVFRIDNSRVKILFYRPRTCIVAFQTAVALGTFGVLALADYTSQYHLC